MNKINILMICLTFFMSSMVFLSCKSNSYVNESGDKDSGDIFIDKDTYTVPDHESTDSEDSDLIFDYENDAQDQDTDSADDSDSCIKFTDFYSNGAGNESCPCQNDVDRIKREFSSGSATAEGFVLKIDEIMVREEDKEVIPRGECGKENKCGITFRGYDRSLFKDSLIGKEWILYWIEGFYGDVYGEYASRDVQVVRHKDGTLIAVSGIGIVNEDGEHESDPKVWPSELVPEVKVEQKILSTCESFCMKFQSSADGEPLGDWQYDDLIAPPLEITVTGKKPVVVRNGEVIRSEEYEYFARDSIRATENDPDGSYFIYGKKYQFDFFIVNTEALK